MSEEARLTSRGTDIAIATVDGVGGLAGRVDGIGYEPGPPRGLCKR